MSAAEPSDALSDLYDAAQGSYDLFRAFMVGGFDESQALRLVAHVIFANQQGGQ